MNTLLFIAAIAAEGWLTEQFFDPDELNEPLLGFAMIAIILFTIAMAVVAVIQDIEWWKSGNEDG